MVCSLQEALSERGYASKPEPDYAKWLDYYLSAEASMASEESTWEKNSTEEREAWRIFGNAVSATLSLLELQQSDPAVFNKVARHFSGLPCIMSRHPDSERFNTHLFKTTPIGEEGFLLELAPHGRHYANQSWPVRYAYALINTIHLTLDTYGKDLPWLAEVYGYGVPHPIHPDDAEAALAKVCKTEEKKEELRRIYKDAYQILPKWTKGLTKLRRKFDHKSVLGYWRTGKQMIAEELPDFHLRPEWTSYRGRHYKGGAKAGAIQHAIFKDILLALKTIAGGGKTVKKPSNVRMNRKPQ